MIQGVATFPCGPRTSESAGSSNTGDCWCFVHVSHWNSERLINSVGSIRNTNHDHVIIICVRVCQRLKIRRYLKGDHTSWCSYIKEFSIHTRGILAKSANRVRQFSSCIDIRSIDILCSSCNGCIFCKVGTGCGIKDRCFIDVNNMNGNGLNCFAK